MLAEHYSKKARAFLKTVVCFDDELSDAFESKPLAAQRAASGFDDDEPPKQEKGPNRQKNASHEELHPLDFRAATKAFADNGILCSVLQPDTTGDSLVERIVTLANAADVTILDWQLEGRKNPGSEACRAAIKKIIEQDCKDGGRLRLIVVFTGTDGNLAIQDLEKELAGAGAIRVESEFALTGNHWRVVVFQKPSPTKSPTDVVDYPELPGKVVVEFSKLTDGLLSSAVLHGITAIRDNTHRLLAIFDRDIDGAFLAHRALIPDPDDAEEFLLELLQDELGAIMRIGGLKDCVGGRPSKQWIESNDVCVNNQAQRTSLLKAVTEPSKDKITDFSRPFQQKDKKKVADTVLRALCGQSDDVADRAKKRLSQLSSLYGAGTPPSINDIRMQLGVLIRDETCNSRYLMCLQPLCDSVRISSSTLFPFLILDEIAPGSDAKYRDLYVRLKSGEGVWLQANPLPKKLISYNYDPSQNGACNFWRAKNRDGDAIFEVMEGAMSKSFLWIGEVKIGKAQRIASVLAARFHTLGIDEFEWQRLHQKSG